MAFSTIQPYQYVALRLPSDSTKVEQIVPNTVINLGKYGSFQTNQILGRPYHLTFEILDRSEVRDGKSQLRVVSAAELHAQALVEQAETEGASEGASTPQATATGVDGDAPVSSSRPATPLAVSKSNVNTYDDPSNQKLTMAEIEALKQDDMGSGRELIEKIMQSHSTLDQKTAFSLAKYTLRKHKKYMKRFCVLPLDVTTLIDWMLADREFAKVMEMRNEMVGLVGCWANIHAAGGREDWSARQNEPLPISADPPSPASRYIVVDDTGGLVVAAMAERMGILNPPVLHDEAADVPPTDNNDNNADEDADAETNAEAAADEADPQAEQPAEPTQTSEAVAVPPPPRKPRRQQYRRTAMGARSNCITMVHGNQQPNLGLLRYFNFDANNPTPSHPLYTNLKTLSWLQLLEPEVDTTYQEPEVVDAGELSKMKANKRSAYYRKRRRWERVRNVVDETQAGGFDGLVVASHTDPVSILRHLVPLVAGGGQVVVYSPHIEPLVTLADHYSTARRTAFLNAGRPENSTDFPVDPTLLLAPTVQAARVRQWQVLPGRTHPLMTGRGGAEGYVFVATRVLPAEGKVEARGRPPRGKKAKIVGEGSEKTNLKAATEEEDDVDLPQSPSKRQKTATASQDHLPESSDALTDAVGNAEPDIDTTMED